MEAKVLRAALSAAIRVTVSTSLLGCGGVTSGGQGEAPADSDPPAKNSQGQGVETPEPGYGGGYASGSMGYSPSRAGSGFSAAGAPGVAGNGAGGLATGGGGAALGGAPAGGEPGAGVMPEPLEPCAVALACLGDLQALKSDTWPQLPTTPRATECCQLVIDHIVPFEAPLQCGDEVVGAGEELRWPCCEVLQSPPGTACTPWGPPVPPELDLEQLLAVGSGLRRNLRGAAA
jgi:hypothetical protein